MTTITTGECSVSKCIDFEWKFSVSSSSWNVSNEFTLKDFPNVFSLNMNTAYYSSSVSYHNVSLTISFKDDYLMERFDLIMQSKVNEKKFIFSLIKDPAKSNTFSTNKTIYQETAVFNAYNQAWKCTLMYKNIPRHDNKILYNDFKALFESERHADFSIKTQNKIFKVHKGILSCRCEILAKAIESDMMEKKNNEIQLDEWDPAVIKEFLSFIYTGSCEVSMNPHQLFELTNYYQLEELKLNCIQYLQENMNLKNIVHTLALADEEQYGLGHLQTLAYSFVKNNEASLVRDVDFQDYLTQSINIKNLVFVLRLAYNYNLKGPLERAKEFIKQNYEKVLGNEECKTYLSSQGALLLDILKYTIESSVHI